MGSIAELLQIRLTGIVDHWWRTTHQYDGIVAGWIEAMADHLFIDKALAVFPFCFGEHFNFVK